VFLETAITIEFIDKVEALRFLSGCRPQKFSIHAFSHHLWMELNVISIPLSVYEMSREFQRLDFVNLMDLLREWHLANRKSGLGYFFGSKEVDPKIRFQLRALMLHDIAQCHDPDRLDEKLLFAGFNDTPFDEAVYSVNHNLHCAGSNKPGAAALQPYHPNASIFPSGTFNESCFVDSADFYAHWIKYLISSELEMQIAMLKGLTPSSSYPKKQAWEKNRRYVCGENYDVDFSDTYERELVQFVKFYDDYPLYEEWRCTARRHSRGGEEILLGLEPVLML